MNSGVTYRDLEDWKRKAQAYDRDRGLIDALKAICERYELENLRLERDWRRATRAFRMVCGVAAALWMIAVTLLWRIS